MCRVKFLLISSLSRVKLIKLKLIFTNSFTAGRLKLNFQRYSWSSLTRRRASLNRFEVNELGCFHAVSVMFMSRKWNICLGLPYDMSNTWQSRISTSST